MRIYKHVTYSKDGKKISKQSLNLSNQSIKKAQLYKDFKQVWIKCLTSNCSSQTELSSLLHLANQTSVKTQSFIICILQI
jgi:hypothetical protein